MTLSDGGEKPFDPEYERLCGAASRAALDGRFESSIELAQRAIERNPGDFRAHQLMGASLEDLGRLRESIHEFRKAICCAPTVPDLHTYLGAVLYKAHDFRAARREFDTGIALSPNEWNARVYLALGLRDLENWRGVFAQAQILMRQQSNAPEALAAVGYCLNQQRRWTEAAVYLERALSVDRVADLGNADIERAKLVDTSLDLATSDLILALCKSRRGQDAVALASRYIKENTEDAHAWRRLGEAHQALASITHKHEDWEKADEVYGYAAALAPRDYDLLFLRGAVKLGLGDRRAALRLFREAVAIAPARVCYYPMLIRTQLALHEWSAAFFTFGRLCGVWMRQRLSRLLLPFVYAAARRWPIELDSARYEP